MTLEEHLEEQYWEKHHDFLPDQVEEWKRGMAQRLKQLFARRDDPIPHMKVDWVKIKAEKTENYRASRI